MAKRLYEGMLPLAAELDCPIAGGDTNSWDGPLVISVTALGEVPPERRWRRSGARPGDAILVTGEFGGSILRKQFDFTPRVREALWLAENATNSRGDRRERWAFARSVASLRGERVRGSDRFGVVSRLQRPRSSLPANEAMVYGAGSCAGRW